MRDPSTSPCVAAGEAGVGKGGSSPSPPARLSVITAPPLQSEEKRVTVLLNVYSLVDSNKTLGKIGMGVFHSGVVLYGIEWGYGECLAHPEATGLFLTRPGTACGTLFRTVNLGVTTITPEDVDVILHQLEREWRGSDYHILDHNCNHFAQTFCDCLSTVEQLELPAWCNRAARVTSRVVPRRLATKIKNMMDPPDAKEKYVESGPYSQSVIPPNWFKHPSVWRPPKNVPHRERDPRRVSHTRASRSFTSISTAWDDAESSRLDDGFDFALDDTESCSSRVCALASVELQPQLLDQLRLRRRSSSISMSTDRTSIHATELATRKGGLGSRGRGRGGRASHGPLAPDAAAPVGKVAGGRGRGRHFAAPTEASLRRERLSAVQNVASRGGTARRAPPRLPSTRVGAKVTPLSTVDNKMGPSKLHASDGKPARKRTPSNASAKRVKDQTCTPTQLVELGVRLSDAAGPVLDSPVLSDISDPEPDGGDDAVQVDSSPTQAPLVMHTMPPPADKDSKSAGAAVEDDSSSAVAAGGSEEALDDAEGDPPAESSDDEEDDFPFFQHLDPSMLAGPVGILMVKKSRRRAQSIQERKELLLRAIGNNGGDGTKAVGGGASNPSVSKADEDAQSTPPSTEQSEKIPMPPTTAPAGATVPAPRVAGEKVPTRPRAASSATPGVAPTPGRQAQLLDENGAMRRHTVSSRVAIEVISPTYSSPAHGTTAGSPIVRRKPSLSSCSSSCKVFHLPPMSSGAQEKSVEDSPARETFGIQGMAAQGFAGFVQTPTGLPQARYPRRGSLPSLSSEKERPVPLAVTAAAETEDTASPGVAGEHVDDVAPPPPPAPTTGEKHGDVPACAMYPRRQQVARKRSPTCTIGAETTGTPLHTTGPRPTPLFLVEDATS